jgi:hypothetical protein
VSRLWNDNGNIITGLWNDNGNIITERVVEESIILNVLYMFSKHCIRLVDAAIGVGKLI